MKSLLFLFLLPLSMHAQTLLSGSVTDSQGQPIPRANVVLQGTYDGASTNVAGRFEFTTLEKGAHVVTASFVGYTSVSRAVELTGTALELTFVLKEEINELDAVVISAGSFTAGEERRRTVLKPLDIAMTAGGTADIAGALNTLPGTQRVGESGRLFVRGGDGNEARTFIDGLVVLDAYAPAAPNTPSRQRFSPFMFKGTSFSTGGYSAEYGQALSSALVLNSRDEVDQNQTNISLMSVGGDVAHAQTWGTGSAVGKMEYTNIRPYFGLIQQEVDWKTPPASVETSGAVRQRIGKDGLIKVYGNYSTTDFALFQHDILNPASKQLLDVRNTFGYGNAAYQQSLSDKWSVRGGFSYSFNENKLALDSSPLAEREAGMHAKAVAEHSLSDAVELRLGVEHFDRTYEASRWVELAGENQTLSFNERLTAAFAEGEWYLSKRWVTRGGLRAEYNASNSQAAADPRLSLAYKPGGAGQFSFAYGTFRQSAANVWLRANRGLDAERAQHVILNYQRLTNRRTFRVEGYYKRYTDLVKFENRNPLWLNNTGSGWARGGEIFWRDNETIKNADYWISYSFLDTERDYLNFPVAAAPTFASRHNFSAVYKHFVPQLKMQFGATYSLASGRPYFNPNLPDAQFHSQRTPAFHDFSANIAYLPKNWLIIYLSCTNLFGHDNIFGYQFSGQPNTQGEYIARAIRQPAPRFAFVGVFITFSKNKVVNQLPNL
jgi:hypothetical protein